MYHIDDLEEIISCMKKNKSRVDRKEFAELVKRVGPLISIDNAINDGNLTLGTSTALRSW